MLLFVEPIPPNTDGWHDLAIEVPGGRIRAAVAQGAHSVAIELGARVVGGDVVGGEAVGVPEAIGGGAGSPVSDFHVPSHYRWESGPLTFWFDSSWREGGPSLTVSLRHLRSLRSHPRAVVIDDDGRTTLDLEDSPVAAVAVGIPTETTHPVTDEPAHRIDWRGWHVLEVDDPFSGPALRVLTTHTQAWWS